MKAIINMTTAFLLLLMFLFGWSLVTYNENPEKYQWLDANGEFKTSSYDVEVSYNLDTPLDDLNGYSLNEVFEDENYYYQFTTFAAFQVSYVYQNNEFLVTTNNTRTYYQPSIWSDIVCDLNDYFYTSAYFMVLDTEIQLIGWRFNNSSPHSFLWYYTLNEWVFNSAYTQHQGNTFVRTHLSVQIPTTTIGQYQFKVKNPVAINLTSLGINQTKDEMDYWYSEYQRLQDNQIENYKELGSTVESSWQFLTGYFTTLVDIIDAQVQVILNPFEALAEGLSIITVPIFG